MAAMHRHLSICLGFPPEFGLHSNHGLTYTSLPVWQTLMPRPLLPEWETPGRDPGRAARVSRCHKTLVLLCSTCRTRAVVKPVPVVVRPVLTMVRPVLAVVRPVLAMRSLCNGSNP